MPVKRDTLINWDLENTPIEIMTDGKLGSSRRLRLRFETANNAYAGGVGIFLSEPPRYWIGGCSEEWGFFPTNVTNEINRVWRITIDKNTLDIKLQIHCNGEKELDMILSDETCSNTNYSRNWSKDVEKIYFNVADNASNYIRPGNFEIVVTFLLNILLRFNNLMKGEIILPL